MTCSRCRGAKKLCYACLEKLASQQGQLIEKMQETAAAIFHMIDWGFGGCTNADMQDPEEVWEETEKEHNCRIRK